MNATFPRDISIPHTRYFVYVFIYINHFWIPRGLKNMKFMIIFDIGCL